MKIMIIVTFFVATVVSINSSQAVAQVSPAQVSPGQVPQGQVSPSDIVQITADGTSTADVPSKARSESLTEALNKGVMQIITGLIGDSRTEKSMPMIRSKILTQTQKFVQFYKATEPQKKGVETTTTVNMKISVSSLKDLLAAQGILNQSEGLATVLPVIKVTEKRDGGHAFKWWMEEASPANSFARDQVKAVIHQFETYLRSKNFYLIDPVSAHYVQWMPQPYRVEQPAMDDLLWMSQFFAAQIVMAGDVTFEPGTNAGVIKLTLKLTAYHGANGRVVGEVARNFETNSADWEIGVQQLLHRSLPEVAKDMTSQIVDEWNRGTLGSTSLRLALHGDFNFQDLESFKKQVTTKIGDVRTIRERRLEKGSATYEVDSSGGLEGLAKILETTPFQGFKLSVQQLGHNQVDVRWTKAGA